MGAKDKAGAAASAAKSAGKNPYLQRIVHDAELRDNMAVAFENARNAYARLSNGKAPTKALLEDKKLHKDLKRSADALRDASTALRNAPKANKPKKKSAIGRLLLVSILGGAIALAVSEGLRNKLLDALFGAEEEFDYTSNTAPTPAETQPVS
ncbi:MAG: hypothetical protein M3401_18235 [Actinomycetota bacterium]|nr:hypothetical protein [Actinomycetota bacterium]